MLGRILSSFERKSNLKPNAGYKNLFFEGQLEKLDDRVLLAVDFFAGPLATPLNSPDVGLGTISGFAPVEPTIVVNPANPAQVAVSSHNGLRLSQDGGANFSGVFNFTNPAGTTNTGGDTDLVFDSQGRLYWANLAGIGSLGVSINEVNPITGATISNANVSSNVDDKEFITADQNLNSPFRDNLYMVWTTFSGPVEIMFSRSVDNGATWSAPTQISNSGIQGFVWPSDVGVAPNGDVYVSWHSQPGFNGVGDLGGNPDGVSGQIFVRRSTNGGQTFGATVAAFGPGQADITFNIQNSPGAIPQTDFWMQGQGQPWVLPDPARPGQIYIVASDDPDNVHGTAGDDANIVIARSADNGLNWQRTTIPVDVGPGSHQLFPTAAIDEAGNIVVSWYDTRNGVTNVGGNFLLDVFATYSIDGGITWAAPFQVNDLTNAFDPDIGAVNRTAGPPPTTRIGEYFGIDVFGGTAYVAWNGSNPVGGPQTGHQVVYDSFSLSGSIVVTGDDSGFATDDTITVRRMATNTDFVEVLVNGQRQYAGLLAGLQQINVNGLGGNDTLIVDSSNGVLNSPFGIRYDGGTGFDTLSMQQIGGSQTSETIVVGATNGSGTDTIVGAGGTQVVQYENLEPIITNVISAALNINGGTIGSLLNAANAINYATSNLFGATWGMVTIDAFEPIHFTNKTNLNIDAEAGSDEINLNNPNTPTALTNINIDGDDPTASDTLIVNGRSGLFDTLRHSPTDSGAGNVVNDSGGQPAIAFEHIEHLNLVVQEADNDEIRLDGTTGDDRFEFFHGATADNGIFRGTMDENGVTTGPFTLTETTYFGVSAATNDIDVNFFVTGGSDTLVFNGTAGNDNIQVNGQGANDIEIINTVNGDQVAFLEVFDITSALVRGHNGSDVFNHEAAVQVTTNYEGGNPGTGSDSLNLFGAPGVVETALIEPGTNATEQDVTGLGAPILVSGVELITYSGENNDDTLIVELEDGFKTAQLSDGPDGNGPAYDQLISDTLPLIRFRDLAMFEVDNDDLGEITIITDDLNEAATFLVDGDGDETLIIQGQDAQGDDYTVSLDGSGNVQIVDNNEGVTITTTGINGANDHLVLRTRGDDDLLTVDVNGTDLIDVLITYEGGGGSDALTITGTPSVTVNSVTYAPGPDFGEGRLTYDSTGNNMTIDFTDLEPVTDLVTAANLNIDATNGDNAVTYVVDPNNANQGRVTVDGFEWINFANKTALNLNALGGSDQITINNPNVPTGLTNININGGPGANDKLTVIGTPGDDTFTLTNGNLVFNTLNVSFAGVSSMLVPGRGGNDTYNVRATSLPVTLAGNSGNDTFNVSSNAPNLSGNLDAISNGLWIDGGTGANSLNVSDFSAATDNHVNMSSSSITGFAPATILYAATGGSMDIALHGSDTNADQFVVHSLLIHDTLVINGNGGNDRFVLKSAAAGNANFFGNAGNDIFRVELVGGNNRQVGVSGGTGNDNLLVVGGSAADIFALDTTSLTEGGETVNFNTVESIQVYGKGDDDTFNVLATNVPVVLNGGSGNDTFNITTAFPGGNLDNINGHLSILGGSGSNSLNISDLTGAGNTVFVTDTHILGLAPVPIHYTSTGNSFDIVVEGSNNADSFFIVSLNVADTLTISGNGGNDHFHVTDAALGNMNLSGNSGDDSFVVVLVGSGNRQVTVDGGIGTNTLAVYGTNDDDTLRLLNGKVTSDDETVNYSAISTLYVNALDGSDVVHVNTGAAVTRVDGGDGNDHLAVHNTHGINNLTVNGDAGFDLLLVKRSNALTYLNGGSGDDHINIGSTQTVDFGNLDLITQVVTVTGGSGSDHLYLNDRAAVGEFEYDVTPQSVSNTATGPARTFAGVNYVSGIQELRLDGTDDRNVFSVRPSFTTQYFIDGNLPSRNQVNAASEGDFLNLITVPNDGHRLTLTDRDTGTGVWKFTNGLDRVDFTEIEQFNHVERLAIGSDAHTINQVAVRDAETGNHLFDIQPYEASFKGGVHVATGDINGDGIPDIITGPGHGRASTVKVFDGWDGSEIKSFDVYDSHMLDGVYVAAGNVTGHKAIDIVTAAGHGGKNSEVRVFRNTNHGATFTNAWGYLPYGSHAHDGASVAVGNVNNDAYDDIITAPLHGNVQIAVFAGKAGNQAITELARFNAFGSDFFGGAYVAAGDYLGDGSADIIVGAGHNPGPNQYSSLVQVFDGASLPNQPANFIAADFSFTAFNDRQAVRLAAKDHNLNGQLDAVYAGQGPHGQADQIRVFQPLSGAVTDTVFEDFDGVFLG